MPPKEKGGFSIIGKSMETHHGIQTVSGCIRHCAAALADMILPRECIVCGDRLDITEKHLCIRCMAELPYTFYWKRRHNPMADRLNGMIQHDIAGYEPYSYAIALFYYCSETGYGKIPQVVKYHGDIPAGIHFGSMLGKRILEAEYLSDADLIVPVPLHWTRLWKRGYNQAEMIAKGISGTTGIRIEPRLLYRRRRTRTQTVLDNEAKMDNVDSAFAVRKNILGKLTGTSHILVVDDVFTTGATANACHRALRRNFGPDVRISVATLGFVGE